MGTIWESKQKSFDKLSTDIDCDVAIIGGGIAGLWCAYHLVNAGKNVCILEAKQIGSGVTAGSTAILTYAQDVIYHPVIKKHGADVAMTYLLDSKTAIRNIKKIVQENKVDCDWEKIDYVLFSRKRSGAKALRKETKAYAELGTEVKEICKPDLPYRVKRALKFGGSYQFNPLKLAAWLTEYITKKGARVFENTLVHETPDGNTLKVDKHKVTAKHFIVASHFPYINVPGFYWLKVYQEQNYCMAITPPKGFEDFCKGTSYESIDKTGFEYRRVGDKILVDGVPVRTGKKPYKSKHQILKKHVAKTFGWIDEEVNYKNGEAIGFQGVTPWSAQDCITMDKLPYAGRYSHFADNVFVVTGFNKWGMTNSFITTNVVSNMILGKLNVDASPDENIYSPQRVALFVNLIETIGNVATIAASFANDLLNVDTKKLERIGPGQGAIIKHNGHRVGASRDEDGKVHMITGICPHMGCNLKWNKDERTFDCPCHGSRFDTKGNIVNNPSTKNAEYVVGK